MGEGGSGYFTVSTTDFFFPLVEDPYTQGRIAACNVLSDMYAVGATRVDTVLMLLAACLDMVEVERDVVTVHMMRGFSDCVREAGSRVTGGQTVLNPWPIIGGVAISVLREEEFIRPEGVQAGHVLLCTKPLGTQVAVNVWQWRERPEKWAKIAHIMDVDRAARAYDKACVSMCTLNRVGAQLMHTFGASGATDITGFGLLGHAQNLAEHAHAHVDVEIHTLPVIADMLAVEEAIGHTFKLRAGRSAETSGGLLIALPPAAVDAFITAYKHERRRADAEFACDDAWIVGRVVAGSGTARIADDAAIIHV